MLVIHGIWAYGALQVWAEDSGLPAQAPPRAGRPSRAPRPHPFAAPPDVLAEVLADALTDAPSGAGTGDLPRKAVDDEITLRLPSAFSVLFALVALALLLLLLAFAQASAAGVPSTGLLKTAGYVVLVFAALGVYLFYDAAQAGTGGKRVPLGNPLIH